MKGNWIATSEPIIMGAQWKTAAHTVMIWDGEPASEESKLRAFEWKH